MVAPAQNFDLEGLVNVGIIVTVLFTNDHTVPTLWGVCIVQKRQLLFAAEDLTRSLPDKVFQRARQVCLIVIAGSLDRVENRHAIPKQRGGAAGAFYPIDRGPRHTHYSHETSLRGAVGESLGVSVDNVCDHWVDGDQPAIDESLNECFGIFKVGILQRRSVEPEKTCSRRWAVRYRSGREASTVAEEACRFQA